MVGRPWAFCLALTAVVAWAATGRLFHFSDTWQLVINTSTTIVTFLIVFLIQETQNHDTAALHAKLDEVIRAIREANDDYIGIEDLDEEDLSHLRELSKKARIQIRRGA